ncbi:1-deoxy-D-xylulose-5-phosphate synthase [Candidatus Fermentibacteria bacterium]|nr:1-deoxy-D-xylulose-5-phosphate synthase [Candidatus Fermentibacteria bacterium]
MAILESISGPRDVKDLSMEDRVRLAEEIRRRIVEVVSSTGGHLASSLGVVELTIALLSVYDLPRDKLIWDVGHQSYPYKLLTGRADRFDSIRQTGGLSGFPRRDESEYDVFGTGHSSTAISAALGFARARDLRGERYKVLAVVGDGAMTGGMALEGLNNLGNSGTDMTVVLNDNEMSISRNVGAISRYLNRILTDPTYNRFRNEVWNLMGKIPSLGERMRKAAHMVGTGLKGTLVAPGTLFDEFGVRYIGPVPGHDLPLLTGVLHRVGRLHGQFLVHVVTRKGKGYPPAESDATGYHGVSAEPPCDRERETFTSVFSGEMLKLAESDPEVCAITAAMPDGTGLSAFASEYPDRFFDVGIAEQHALTFACGLAFGGMKPVAAIYSTFMQRAVDQLIHDAALQDAPVVLSMDRAGVVGADGPTHHGVFDMSLFAAVPRLRICAPRNGEMLRLLLRKAVGFENGPTLLRYPKGKVPSVDVAAPSEVEPGKGQLLREGEDVLVVAVGTMCEAALQAAEDLDREGISVAVYDPVWIKPLPTEEIVRLSASRSAMVSVEEGSLEGGVGQRLSSVVRGKMRILAIPDDFQPHGSRAGLLRSIDLDAEGVRETIKGLHDEKS